MLYINHTSQQDEISLSQIKQELYEMLPVLGNQKRILIIPPDITRYHSMAGNIARYLCEYYQKSSLSILPATGFHTPMTEDEKNRMFGTLPEVTFHAHDPINNLTPIGSIPGHVVGNLTHDIWQKEWPCQVNPLFCSDDFDLVVSIGQVVPHEVAGMSNFNKNIFVGIGGKEGIDISHYISALYGIENTMGEIDTPVRRIFNYASDHFLTKTRVLYILTVIHTNKEGKQGIKGFFIGDDTECFISASRCSQSHNIFRLPGPVNKMVVYLDPLEYKSTWLGNKGIYRTRMAVKKGGELVLIAPGLSTFGEIKETDRLIRKYGYAGRKEIQDCIHSSPELLHNLSVAAHLIHGSTNNDFTVTLCPGKLTKEEVEQVNFKYGDIREVTQKYNPDNLKPGYNNIQGEDIYFINNPGLGLWST